MKIGRLFWCLFKHKLVATLVSCLFVSLPLPQSGNSVASAKLRTVVEANVKVNSLERFLTKKYSGIGGDVG